MSTFSLVIMATDLHAHVTVDLPTQLARARLAGVERTILVTTRTHPEAHSTLDGLRAEYARFSAVIGGAALPLDDFRVAMAELRAALDRYPDDAVGLAQVPLGLDQNETSVWLDGYLGAPGIAGIGELTPAPDRACLIEPVLATSADHGGLPVLVHGFAPNALGDLRTYAQLAARYSRVPMIVGAFGGLHSMDLIDLALERPNLYLDLSSALQLFVVRAAVNTLPERCLFGSNTPYGDVVAARHAIEAAVTDPHLLARVLDQNIAGLIEK
jgi:predicted TIM-barrel fold metal-dependent hydrolase